MFVNHASLARQMAPRSAPDDLLRQLIIEEGVCVSLKKGDLLCEEGKPASNVYLMIEGPPEPECSVILRRDTICFFFQQMR